MVDRLAIDEAFGTTTKANLHGGERRAADPEAPAGGTPRRLRGAGLRPGAWRSRLRLAAGQPAPHRRLAGAGAGGLVVLILLAYALLRPQAAPEEAGVGEARPAR